MLWPAFSNALLSPTSTVRVPSMKFEGSAVAGKRWSTSRAVLRSSWLRRYAQMLDSQPSCTQRGYKV